MPEGVNRVDSAVCPVGTIGLNDFDQSQSVSGPRVCSFSTTWIGHQVFAIS
jgi:hypothetical protein